MQKSDFEKIIFKDTYASGKIRYTAFCFLRKKFLFIFNRIIPLYPDKGIGAYTWYLTDYKGWRCKDFDSKESAESALEESIKKYISEHKNKIIVKKELV